MDLNKQKNKNVLNQKKVSKLLVFAILTNAIIIVLFVAFVFGLRPDLFEIDTKKLDRQMILYIDTINKNIDEYSSRIKKIAVSYPFEEFVQSILVDKDVTAEKEKILSLFRMGEHTFSSVSIFMLDGKNVFSIPINMFKNQIMSSIPPYAKMPIIAYDKNYEGINFIQNITNAQGITTSYINASVDKKIFNNTPSKNKFMLFDNSIIFYNEGVNVNTLSKDTLSLMSRNTKKDKSELLKIDSSPYILYSSSLDKIQDFNIAIIVKDIPAFQKYLRHIILSLFSLSFVTMLIFAFIENRKNAIYVESDILNDIENELEDFSDELYPKDTVKNINKQNYYDKKVIEKISEDFDMEELYNDLTIPIIDEQDDINNNNSSQEEVMIKDGITLEEEINRKEEEYFSTKNAFNIALDEDFLLGKTVKTDGTKIEENDEDEKIKLEDIDLNTLEMDEADMYEATEVPKIPEAYFSDNNEAEEVYQFQSVIDVVKKSKFKNKSFDEIIDYIEKKSNTEIKGAAMLKLIEDGSKYIIDDIRDISLHTKNTLEIDISEPLFTKFLSHKKPLYVKNPFDSIVISKKFIDKDTENTSSMLFIPIENNNGILGNFFIALF